MIKYEKYEKGERDAMLNFVMCLAAGAGISMWKNPTLFRSFWKDWDDPEGLDGKIRTLGLMITALVIIYLLYLAVKLFTVG